MKISTLFVILLVAGIFGVGFNLLIQDMEGNLQTNYNTTSLHSSGNEKNYSYIFGNLTTVAQSQADNATQMQDRLQDEDEISELSTGKVTLSILKQVVTFGYLSNLKSLITNIGGEFGVNPIMLGLIFAIFVIIIIFLVIGAILRWKVE